MFTASEKVYADLILNYIDPDKKYFDHRLYRDDCLKSSDGYYIKDLRIISNRNLKNIVLVDNSPVSYILQMENAVPIVSFLDCKVDENLKDLTMFLSEMYNTSDVRNFLSDKLKLNKFSNFENHFQLIKTLFNAEI